MGNALGYWRGLWDFEHRPSGVGQSAEEIERWNALRSVENRGVFERVRSVVEAYERKCGYVWVQMDALFKFALKKENGR